MESYFNTSFRLNLSVSDSIVRKDKHNLGGLNDIFKRIIFKNVFFCYKFNNSIAKVTTVNLINFQINNVLNHNHH